MHTHTESLLPVSKLASAAGQNKSDNMYGSFNLILIKAVVALGNLPQVGNYGGRHHEIQLQESGNSCALGL